MIGLIWAQAANGVVGRDNAVPWQLPEDMAHFRALTTGSTVVMGRRTWESLPPRFRPLPGRRNVVLTRTPSWRARGAQSCGSLDDALRSLDGDAWVIGGAEVWAAAMPRADVLEVTELQESFDGDVYAPAIGPEWTPGDAVDWRRSDTGLHYRFRTYRRSSTTGA